MREGVPSVTTVYLGLDNWTKKSHEKVVHPESQWGQPPFLLSME